MSQSYFIDVDDLLTVRKFGVTFLCFMPHGSFNCQLSPRTYLPDVNIYKQHKKWFEELANSSQVRVGGFVWPDYAWFCTGLRCLGTIHTISLQLYSSAMPIQHAIACRGLMSRRVTSRWVVCHLCQALIIEERTGFVWQPHAFLRFENCNRIQPSLKYRVRERRPEMMPKHNRVWIPELRQWVTRMSCLPTPDA